MASQHCGLCCQAWLKTLASSGAEFAHGGRLRCLAVANVFFSKGINRWREGSDEGFVGYFARVLPTASAV